MTAEPGNLLDRLVSGGTGPELPAPAARHRLETDPERPAHGLTTLVLAIVELLRQLMERQALRRMDHDDLSEDQIENLGATLLALEEQMARLREHFGLSKEDLNLDLGPLGSLLPRE
jgi:uncharacterized protein YjiS (DUF1127 family)